LAGSNLIKIFYIQSCNRYLLHWGGKGSGVWVYYL